MRLRGILTGFLVQAAQASGPDVALPLLGKLRGSYSNRKLRKWTGFLMALTARFSTFGFPLLILFVLLLGTARPAQAGTAFCSDFNGVIDGYDSTTRAIIDSSSTLGLDMDCTIKNFPASIGGFPITNINFYFPQHSSYYIIFDNVDYAGHMSCNDPTQSDFWIYWVNGTYTNISSSCQEFMVPVDAILKQNPTGQTTATIGVPFTYTLTMPVMGRQTYTGFEYFYGQADSTDLHDVVITDDLTKTGAALSLVGQPTVSWSGGGQLNPGTDYTFTNSGGLLTFHIPLIPANQQIVINLPVVLDNTSTNVAGLTQFFNTAMWNFRKTINGTTLQFDGQMGITPPMTIVEPNLVVTKTSSMPNLNVGTKAPYTINVQNIGASDAWDTTITDNLPAGMCAYDPTSTVTAQIFASDGVTPVSGPLVNGTDFSITWNGGSASDCQLGLTMLTPAAKIGPTQHLIINYDAMLDAGISSGTFTNVAGATRWFSAESSYSGRREYDKTLTNGTPGVLDFQDAYTITAAVIGYYFLKSIQDLTTGIYPATAAFPGDRLRYTLQVQNYNIPPLNNITANDDLGALNGFTAFVPGSLSLASTDLPAGTYTICSTCGTNGAGTVTINGLHLGSNVQYQIQFDVTLASNLTNGTIVRNQGSLSGTDIFNKVWSGVSDDPYINGPSLLSATGDITPITIHAPGALSKSSPTPSTATIGQEFSYLITVPAVQSNLPLYDVTILDNLPANLSFVSAQVVSGGAWNLTNTGTANSLVIQDTTAGIDIPAGGQAVIKVTVALQNTTTNHSGVSFTNSASYTYNMVNGGGSSTQATGGAGTSTPMNVVEPHLTATKTVSYASPSGKPITDPAAVGDILQYIVTVTNNGNSDAFDADIVDTLAPKVSLVSGSATAQINGSPVSGFLPNPTTLTSGAMEWGNLNGDPSLDIPVNGILMLTYQVRVLSADGSPINNTLYAAWTSLEGGVTGERTGDGCPNITLPNNYCSGPAAAAPVPTLDPSMIVKSVVSDTWNSGLSTGADSTLRVGDTVVYSLALTLRQGVTQNVVVTDALTTGLAFDSVLSINGDTTAPYSSSGAFSYTDISAASVPTAGQTGTLTWTLGNITNNSSANSTFVIQYRAKVVKNTLAQTPTTQTLTNNAALNYAINGVAATPKTSSATINVWQPILSVSKSAAPAGGDTVISAGELITYTVDITNTGAAPAYNTVLTDTLPVGLRQAGVTTTSITLVKAGAVLPLLGQPNFSYSTTTGVAFWNFDTGVANVYAIPPGETLRVIYRVTADGTLGAGVTLVNNALVQSYYSFDSRDVPTNSAVTDRQVYGPSSVATVQLTTAAATALSKQALVSTVAIGQPFTYEITIPASPQPTAMYDVHVLDDLSLATTGVTISYVGASAHLKSGTQSWATLTNSGTAANLILQDTTSGMDIPAGDQLVVDVTVVLNNDTVNNTPGKQFQNTASYTYDSVNNDRTTVANGAPGASGAVTIVGPNLTMQKSGPSTMRVGVAGTFGLNVQNTGTGAAWGTTLTDILPNVTSPSIGGMCGSAPTNVTARIYQSDGVTLVSDLVSGTDFNVSFAGAPSCTWTIAMNSTATTAIAPTNRLIVTYQASLDPGSASGLALTNVAGATQYLSADPTAVGASSNVHTYTNTLTNGTPGILDYQDVFTVTTESPVLTFTKTVTDVTTGQSGATARPGDTLKYTLTIQNISTLSATDFSLTDELDKLNSTAMFAPGSLTLLTVPAGADTSLTSATGGPKGTGLVSIGRLNIDTQGGANDKLVIEFQARLVPAITNGTKVLNQAQVGSSTLPTQLSDDPSLGGATDPTLTTITSAPAFRILKTVQDITSGNSTVMAGDTLRYTITVKNIGTENAIGVTLRDLVPLNTSYVANSTRLNGTVVADPGAGVGTLQSGMLINSPANPTAGVMPADASAAPANAATISFDVQINTNVVDGTIISNQGFVNGSGAGSGPFPEQPSDDPATPVLNDPTRVVVGNVPLVYALKTVNLAGDVNGNGLVDPGDRLRYTITLTNSAATPATGVVLTDAVPANTTYVANTTTLNGGAVADPGAAVSPLANGMGVVSVGLTAPSPPSSGGTLAAHGAGTVTFDVMVNAGVPSGTIISNQGTLRTAQLPPLPTDSDGNPTNGYQPTLITVGDAQQLSITKSVVLVGGGLALPGSVLEYTIQATNVGTVPATGVVITDDLDPISAQVTYVAGSATMNGATSGVSYASSVVIANYGTTYGTLAPGSSVGVRFRVQINGALAIGTTIANTGVVRWNTPAQTAQASVSIRVGGTPAASASLSGRVWHDANLNRLLDSGSETGLQHWPVELYLNNQLIATQETDANGAYSFSALVPNAGTSDLYELRFRADGAGPNTASMGQGDSPFTNGPQRISAIIARPDENLQNLNLPLQPNGVVYNSVRRRAVAGARLALLNTGTRAPLPTQCFDDPVQQNQVTAQDGFYKFDLNFSDASCPAGGAYLIRVTPPATGYTAPSQIIPPARDENTDPFDVTRCPGSAADAVPATTAYCEATTSPAVPQTAPRTAATLYYLHLLLDNGLVPGHSQVFNNPIPLDPELNGAVAITKVASKMNVTRGELVPYTITVTNVLGAPQFDLAIVDNLPGGFKYVAGSARLDGNPKEPKLSPNRRQLTWSDKPGENDLYLDVKGKHTLKFLLVVGSGVSEAEYINRAQAFNTATGEALSGEANATVRVIPDPTFDCTDVIGKVFDDRNLNGEQDPGEEGLFGVRVVTARGLIASTDQYGRFHITCAAVPDEDRGSNFILKLDERSLPTGYRLTTENPRVQRATRGKMIRFNFGATIHRVVRLDIADGAFEPNTVELRLQWTPRIPQLIEELKKAPSVLRLSYLADVEHERLVHKRLDALKKEITSQWDRSDGGYRLAVETEVFWRRGAPLAGR
jgi:uncharacterized repeat protein (TIGR01451 family)/fimbrial isopeptide formation D2 family protein